MSASLSPVAMTAYRTFATWRRDILAAGFMAKGAPLAAYRALDAIHMGRSADVQAALGRAIAAYAEWCAEPGPTRDHCQPTLDALRAELAAFDLPMTPGRSAYEADCAGSPLYHDGTARKTWAHLGTIERWSWERNPTPRGSVTLPGYPGETFEGLRVTAQHEADGWYSEPTPEQPANLYSVRARSAGGPSYVLTDHGTQADADEAAKLLSGLTGLPIEA